MQKVYRNNISFDQKKGLIVVWLLPLRIYLTALEKKRNARKVENVFLVSRFFCQNEGQQTRPGCKKLKSCKN